MDTLLASYIHDPLYRLATWVIIIQLLLIGLAIAITIFLYFVCVTYLTVISSQVTHILNEGKGSCDPHCSHWRQYIAHHESGCHKQGSPWIMVTIPVVLLVS